MRPEDNFSTEDNLSIEDKNDSYSEVLSYILDGFIEVFLGGLL